MSKQAGQTRVSLDRMLTALNSSGVPHTHARDHIQAECPTHNDTQPSLSIDFIPGEARVKLHCQTGGCDVEEIVAAIGLTYPQLFDDYEEPEVFAERRARERAEEAPKQSRRKTVRPRTPTRAKPALPAGRLPSRLTEAKAQPQGTWQVTTTYEYTDIDGTVVQEEVRHQRQVTLAHPSSGEIEEKTEKRFTQRWPDDKGGWLSKAPSGFVPVLYRMPELVEAIDNEQRVWLCEGAKDAERFIALGEAATTNPSGAGNFKAEQAAVLAGAHVVVVLDHDLAGYRRGLKVAGMVTEAASLRFALPATSGRHQDASDHFDAGHEIDDFVEVSADRLRLLEQITTAEEAALTAGVAEAEALERMQRAAAGTKTAAKTEERHAARWAVETGKHLVKAAGAWDSATAVGPLDDNAELRLREALSICQSAASAAHAAAGVALPEELMAFLEEPVAPEAVSAPASSPVSNIEDHPTRTRLPDPHGDIPMSRGLWRYELGGEGRRNRGVYQYLDGRWDKSGVLPYLHARIISRDGYGRPIGTYYLVSATQDGVKVTIGHDELAKHTWPNILGVAVSHDDKILKACTTALIFAAEEETEMVEATPLVNEDGTIALPVPETLPHGYLATSELEREDALAVWAQVAQLAAQSPRMALVLGASAFGPFLAALNRQPHILSLHGDMAQGKSVTMRTAAAIWGHPGSKSRAGVCESWNQSKLAPTSFLGELGVLPAFFDEIGMAGNLNAADWGKRIFDICEGASRGRPAANGRPGFVRGRSWYGVLVSAGNSRLMDGIGAGGMAGTQRRVVELSTPFTHSAAHSDEVEALFPQAYGHLGSAILEKHSASTVQGYIDRAAAQMGEITVESPVAQEIIKHLHSHVAGAAMIDDLCGTGDTLSSAAISAALEYLQDWEAPLHDADRILDQVHDSLFQEPACWPTVGQHIENTAPMMHDGAGSEIARHGVALKTKGLVANDESWIAVFPSVWEELCKELGVDSDVACRELTNRGILIRQGSATRPGQRNHTSVIKVGKATKRFYKLTYPVIEDPEESSGPLDTVEPTASPDAPQGGTSPAEQDTTADQALIPDQTEQDSGAPEQDTTADQALIPDQTEQDSGAPEQGLVTGQVAVEDPPVTAEVTAPTPPLTCEVTAVTAVTAPTTHVGEPARDSSPAPAARSSDLVYLDEDTERPQCLVCGRPTGVLIANIALHRGPCEDTYRTTEQPGEAPPAEASEVARPRRKSTERRGARFTAPAAALDGERVHLADGSTREWPQVTHLGDLALLTGRDQLRLGWGGGEDRLPDPGQIWLYPEALERLGLPLDMPLPSKPMTKSERAKASVKMFGKLDDHPMVAGAREAGWEFGQGGRMAVWTRIWHPELLPGGAFLVGMGWHHIEGVPLFADQPTPEVLVARLRTFAQHVGVAYRLTTAATGLDLIDHHRPPRRNLDDDRGTSRRRIALVRNTPAELPPWRMKTSDSRFTGMEQDFSWWRAWDSLPASEQGLRYVHGYDRNASYLVPWRGLDLGVEGLQHLTGAEARWDGREKPGYYLIDQWEWPSWGLPDPGSAAGAQVGNGRLWVTVHTMKQLAAGGVTPVVHEAYIWSTTARYLEGPGQSLTQAREVLGGSEDPSAGPVLATVKLLYSSTVGKLAERDHRPDFHLWRPDWRDHVIGATKTAILHTLRKAEEISGAHPLAVDRDAVFFASDIADPIQAWPGDPSKIGGTSPGAWKAIGSTEFAVWGPAHLTKQTGRWRYNDAVEALTQGTETQ